MADNPFAAKVSQLLREANLNVRLLRKSYDSKNFGNAIANYALGDLLLSFVRDRGQEFLEIGLTDNSHRLITFDVIQIAMGWKSVEEVLSQHEPTPLGEIIDLVKANFELLQSTFSNDFERIVEAEMALDALQPWRMPKNSLH